MNPLLTHDRLKELLIYRRGSGLFFWRKDHGGHKAGEQAGGARSDGYVRIGIEGRRYYAHRLAWFYVRGEWPPAEIDHRRGAPGRNSFSAIRLADRSQNASNTRKRADNTSGFKGVSFHRASGRWRAEVQARGKRVTVYAGTAKEAAAARRRMACEMHGEFAR